ncbi:hypothetical protein P3T76_002272 [Phytophthora citrophthora]|uniref:UspA domain-containing protein n=1 Tax=Phytophthora citrophthora TaxID=4793 RepID=A0AAD9GX97_9STRA|nr:hypothetical protein P3T76_002272 [Phytophthora citrophthora]
MKVLVLEKMRDVLTLKKVSPALQLCIQSTRLILNIKEPELTDETFRSQLLDRPDEVLAQFKSLGPEDISHWSYEQLSCLMEDADYDPAVAARESESGLFLDLHGALTELRSKMEQQHQDNKCFNPTTTFLIGVDGSLRLRRQGRLAIVNVDEEFAASRQMPQISGEFISDEYKAHCKYLQLPSKRVTILCEESGATHSVAQQLLHIAEQERVDFIILGAHGKGGPAVDQVRHIPREVLLGTTLIPIIVVPPTPVNSVVSQQYVFVVAVDKSEIAARCLNATLKLMRPTDILRVVHFYEIPKVGEFDMQPFNWYTDIIDGTQIDGQVDVKPIEPTSTIAESLQDYLSVHRAAYLVLGLNGEGAEKRAQSSKNDDPEHNQDFSDEDSQRIGRLTSSMLFSPRCVLCLCP